MPQKRFHFALCADSNDGLLQPTPCNQIVFTLIPEGIKGLNATAHPVVYKVWDLRYSESTTLDCYTELGVCTARKDSAGHVVAVCGRIVPGGEYTAVTRHGGVVCWTETRKWQDADTFDSVLVRNDSNTPQAFALCSPLIHEDEYEPTLHPILLFNQIGHDDYLRIRVHLKVQAWYSETVFEQGKQVREKDGLVPLLDENHKPWAIDLKSHSFTSSWEIYKRQGGKIGIKNIDNIKSERVERALRGDIKALESKVKELSDFMNGFTNKTCGDQEIEEPVDILKEQALNLRRDLNNSRENISAVQTGLERCIGDIQELQAIKQRLEEAKSGLQETARLQTIIKEVEKKLQDLATVNEGIPSLYDSVTRLGKDFEILRKESDQAVLEAREIRQLNPTLAENIKTTNEELKELRATVDVAKEELKISGENFIEAAREIALLNSRVDGVQAGVTRAEGIVQGIESALAKKADHDDLSEWKNGLDRVESKLESCEGKVTMLQSSVKQVRARVDKAESSIKDVFEELDQMVRL